MSSNILIQRVCKNCGNMFTARTTVSQSCSPNCAKQWYKRKITNAKIEASNVETEKVVNKPIEEMRSKEFLNVKEASKLLGCCRQTIYDLIKNGTIKAVNIKIKKTIIKRTEIDKIFEIPQHQGLVSFSEKKYDHSREDEYYSTEEVRKLYKISESTLRSLIIKHNIYKFRKGRYAFVPKTIIDTLLK